MSWCCAIAEQDEIHVTKLGQHVRKAGEALLPAWKPFNFLMERKRTQTQASWESEYQQHPIIVGGGVLPIEKLKIMQYWSPQGSDDIIPSTAARSQRRPSPSLWQVGD
jgi:hypothetical protein